MDIQARDRLGFITKTRIGNSLHDGCADLCRRYRTMRTELPDLSHLQILVLHILIFVHARCLQLLYTVVEMMPSPYQ
jgi:hypothetical protein